MFAAREWNVKTDKVFVARQMSTEATVSTGALLTARNVPV